MKFKKVPDDQMTQAAFDWQGETVSTQDCTGAMPAGIQTEAQAESLADMEHIHRSKAPK